MKIRLFLLLVLSTLVAVSCGKDAISYDDCGNGNEIVFSTGDDLNFDVLTKAPTEKTVSNLSSFYVLASTGIAGNSAETTSPGFTCTQFSKISGSNYRGGKYWPASSVSYHFYAATKPLTLSSGNVTFKPSATIADDLYGYVASPTYNASSTPITLNHIYAQIGYCNVTAPSGFTVSGLSVTITPKVPTANATFNVRTGAWSTTSSHYTNGSAVTLCTATGSTADKDLWLVPGTYTLSVSYTLTKETYSASFTKTATVTLVMGKNNNINMQLPSHAADHITLTITLDSWQTGTPGTGTISF